MKINQIKNKKIAILGFGKEGNSYLNFLKKIGAKKITILDKNTDIKREDGVKYILGENYLDNMGDFELIFKTPGISPYQDKLVKYLDKFISGAQIFFDNYKGKVIGVTGTKGKSTTSTLIYETLKNIGYNVKLVGNIGNPVLEEIDILGGEEYDFIVYELSSYMLEQLKPNLYIGLLNNIYNCHLDWHNGRKNYENAKFNVLKFAKYKLANYELKNYKELENLENLFLFGEDGDFYYKNPSFYYRKSIILKDKDILLQGEHNRYNISAIIGILNIILNGDNEKFKSFLNILGQTLKTFAGLEHRIENIGTYKEITFIDDAIATTPESTIAALKTFGSKVSTIFLGGTDSGFKFEKLRDTLKEYNIKNIVLFPDTGEKIFKDYSDNLEYEKEGVLQGYGDYHPNVLKTRTMENAVIFAYKKGCLGKICLLSCAAPSFSLWSGYIEKGNQFKDEVIRQSKIDLK